MAMHVRRLEMLVVYDVGAITLRQRRAQRFYQQYRGFGMKAPLKQLSTSGIGHANDAHVPFEARGSSVDKKSRRGGGIERRKPQGKLEKVDDDWHAEIEITAPHGGENAEAEMETSTETSTRRVETTSVVDWTPARSDESDQDASPRPSHPGPPQISEALVKSRADSRMERKLRRMEAGTYRPDATAAKEHQEVNRQIESVLSKIDEDLEGPSILKTAKASKILGKLKKDKDSAMSASVRPTKMRSTKGGETEMRPKLKRETWQSQKDALEQKFGETGWQPRKRLSPDTLEGIRALHASDPNAYSTDTLSEHFKITPEAIRRILRSKWRPNDEESDDRRIRWERRGAKKWQEMAEQGIRPPVKWRAMGAGGEEGLKEDRLPKRKKSRQGDDGLSWDEVVGGIQHQEEVGTSLADRLL